MYTYQLELLTKCILYADKEVKFQFKDNADTSILYATIGQLSINVSMLMSKVDFSHIQLSKEDSIKYMEIMGNPAVGTGQRPQNDKHHLTDAERHAIRNYTGMHSGEVNDLLYHNKLHWIKKLFVDSPKKRVLQTIMLASALNKIMPKKNRKGFRLYRGEYWISKAELEARKKLVKDKKVSAQLAFYSTSSSKEVAERFKHNSIIIITNGSRKPIKGYSRVPSEKEHIQLPGFIQWIKYKFKKNVHKFYAKIVDPLITRYNRPSDQEIMKFEDLKAWAKSKNINIDFIAPHLRKRAVTPRLRGARYLLKGTSVTTLQGAFRSKRIPIQEKNSKLGLFIGAFSLVGIYLFALNILSAIEVLGGTAFLTGTFISATMLFLVLKSMFKAIPQGNITAPRDSKALQLASKKKTAIKIDQHEQKGIYHLRQRQNKNNHHVGKVQSISLRSTRKQKLG